MLTILLFCGYLLTIQHTFKGTLIVINIASNSAGLIYYYVAVGAGTYSISSRVIPHEVRRQTLGQENPCPGDMVEFTCIRSESTQAIVRWTADGNVLYAFFIPDYIGTSNANLSNIPGFIGILINSTLFTLLVDLNTSNTVNGSQVACDEVDGNSSKSISLSIIGKPHSFLR